MPWHAFTFDGLDTTLADTEFAEQIGAASAVPTTLTQTSPGTVTQVNAPLVNRFMETVAPHIQKAVTTGVAEAVATLHQTHKQKVLIGGIAAGGATLLALAFLWRMSSRLQECCPARPRSMGNCCGGE